MTLKVAVLDVGHGDCAVVYSSDRTSVVVIDCGNGPALLEFLESEGLHHIDVALVTHNDDDHVRGMTQILGNLSVGLVAIHPNIKDVRGHEKRVMGALVDAAETSRIPFAHVTTKDTDLLRGLSSLGYRAELLYPSQLQATQASRSNTTSAVLRVEWANTAILFAGDLDNEGWDRLLSDESMTPRLKSQVLKFPHHGGRLVSYTDRCSARDHTLTLLRSIAPKLTLISTAQHGKYQHPDLSVLDGLRAYATEGCHRFLCTEVTSACDEQYDTKRDAVLALLPEAQTSVYGRSGYPCAGTIRLQFSANGAVAVEADKKYEQIRRLYSNRQCA